jgi:hypothetical protein
MFGTMAETNGLLNPMTGYGHNRYMCGSIRINMSAKYIADTWDNQMLHLHSQPDLIFGFVGFIFMNPAAGSNDMPFTAKQSVGRS